MGSNIFTTHFLFFQEQAYSAIWLRLDLKDFRFSKSQRKLLRRNAKHFAPASAPKTIDAEREALYQVYAENFDGRLSPSIADSLEDYGPETVFNTYETTVREQRTNQLVATSYFDIGQESAASILGFYHPDQADFSLGYYTMLLEIEHCLQHNIRYYYPGYVAPGYARFDYKLRLGNCEYYDRRKEAIVRYP
ncbi:MAG: arginine-tRNA-protein transferase, partial [Bacteroidota bacterium]